MQIGAKVRLSEKEIQYIKLQLSEISGKLPVNINKNQTTC